MSEGTITEEASYTPEQLENKDKPVQETGNEGYSGPKPELMEGQGVLENIEKVKNSERTYYKMTINNTYYTLFVNKEAVEVIADKLNEGDSVKFTWTGKPVGGRMYRNIRYIQKLDGDLTNFAGPKRGRTPEQYEETRKKNVEGMTLGMALNNAAILIGSMANTQDNPQEWLDKQIGGPLWKAIEKKLYENYKEQRTEILGE